MENLSIREVIEMAIRTEKLGMSYYTDLAEKFKDNKEFYDLFTTLGQNEVLHERNFKALLNSVKDEEPEGWSDVSEYLRAYVESAFFLGKDKAMPHLQGVQNVRAAVGLAVSFERETLLFFYALLDIVKDKDKDTVREIIDEEKSHIMWLSKFLNKT